MAAAARPLEEEIRGCVKLLRVTGSLQVNFKDGEFKSPGRLLLLLWPALVVLSDLRFVSALLQLFSNPTDLFTAKQFVAHAARIVFQISLFYSAYFAITKTRRVADILSRFCQLQKLYGINCRVPSLAFVVIFFLSLAVTISNFIYTIASFRATSFSSYFYVVVEVFMLSLTYQIIFFVVLTTSYLRGLNEAVASCRRQTSLGDVNLLRDAREKLFGLFEDVQSTFGLLLTIYLFNRALYVIHDVNGFLLHFVSVLVTAQHAGHVNGLLFNAIWAAVDSSLVCIFIFFCSKLESESKKIGPLLVDLASRLQGAQEKESVLLKIRMEVLDFLWFDLKVLWLITEATSSRFRFSASGLVAINYELLFMLFGLCEDVQSTFGFMLTVFLFNRSLYIIHDCNTLLLHLASVVYGAQPFLGNLNRLVFNAVWIGVDTGLVFICATLGARLERESKRTGILLTELAGRLKSGQEKKSVMWFVAETALSKFQFSASGLVAINYEFIFMAAGSLATNLAILLQAYIMEIRNSILSTACCEE